MLFLGFYGWKRLRYICSAKSNNAPPWPHFDDAQINAATRVLASGKVNTWTGQETKAFESEFAEWCASRHAVAMANGSLALSAAYLSVGLGQGDELITSPRTFIATASSAVLLGAKPIFADVDPTSGAITAATIAPLITPRTKASCCGASWRLAC